MADINFKLSELVILRDGINKREQELKDSLKSLSSAKKKINSYLSQYQGENVDVIIVFTEETFNKIIKDSQSIKNNFNWKKVTLEVLKISGELSTTNMIYEKAKIKYPIELADKEKSIHGFSAAISALTREKKIIKERVENKFYYQIIKKK